MNKQLLLDLGLPPALTFDTLLPGRNLEAITHCRAVADALNTGATLPAAERTLYVWGAPGSGRTHLLHALCHTMPEGAARLCGPHCPLDAFEFDPAVAFYGVDDCEQLSPAAQIAAFNLFNAVRAAPHAALLATGPAAPLGLAVREDLRTRLGWGLVYQLHALGEPEMREALLQAGHARGLSLSPDVPDYLLAHFQRDMKSLMGLFDALDRFSLERHRAITVPLLRTMLADQRDGANTT